MATKLPNSKGTTAALVATAADEARALLNESFARLKEVSKGVPVAGAADKFFPNGIELIHVKVEAGLTATTKVSVELRVAGPKAPAALDGAEGPAKG